MRPRLLSLMELIRLWEMDKGPKGGTSCEPRMTRLRIDTSCCEVIAGFLWYRSVLRWYHEMLSVALVTSDKMLTRIAVDVEV